MTAQKRGRKASGLPGRRRRERLSYIFVRDASAWRDPAKHVCRVRRGGPCPYDETARAKANSHGNGESKERFFDGSPGLD
jgi:hypothetical protein